jgi:LysR family transcriptional regulator, regulator for genes of the gallate degradation pathway
MIANLRHLRILVAVATLGSVSKAARQVHVSQPAVTQALSRMESQLGVSLFDRSPRGLFLTQAGTILTNRITRALALLDPALADLSPRLRLTASLPQVQAVISVTESESFSEAARRLGLAQPTVYRAITQLESEVGRPLFERGARGVVALRPTRALAVAARLALAELAQATTELAELSGRDVGRIVVGAMPLSRACLLGPTIARFRQRRPTLRLTIIDGPFPELALGLRRGEIDILLGALRPDDAVPDLRQEPLFADEMVVVARAGHPLAGASDLSQLGGAPWVVAAEGTPSRGFFDAMFAAQKPPASLVETGSSVLLREILTASDHLGFTSALGVEADLSSGRMVTLPFRPAGTRRPIGLIQRADWQPTAAQSDFIAALRLAASALPKE